MRRQSQRVVTVVAKKEMDLGSGKEVTRVGLMTN